MGELRCHVLKRIVQLKTFNPKYLDKTGEFIWKFNKKFVKWQGGVSGFVFESNDGVFKGGISIDDFNFSTETQSSHNQMEKFFQDGYDAMLEVYKDFDVKRIGYRIIYVAKEKEKRAIKFLKSFYSPNTLEVFNNADRFEFSIRLKSKGELHSTLRMLYGQWEKDGKQNLGLIIDIDVFKLYKDSVKASNALKKDFSGFFQEAIKIHDELIKKIKEQW